MKKYCITLSLMIFTLCGFTQTDVGRTINTLQKLTGINSFEKAGVTLYEATGVLEYTQANTQQRIKLSELNTITVNANASGYVVDVKCIDESGCVSFVKDNATTPFQATAFFFNEAAVANSFAEGIASLVQHYKAPALPLEKKLYSNAEGRTPLLTLKADKAVEKPEPVKEAPEPVAEEKTIAKKDEEKPQAKTAEEKADERAEAKEKKEELKKEKAEADAEKRELRRKARKEKTEENTEQEVTDEKPARRQKRQAVETEEGEEADPRENKKTSRNKLIEDVGDEKTTTKKAKAGDDFCSQLLAILQSGKENTFKTIEGSLTNADTKINASKIKLEGAKKSYLSWFKKERAFIAELKSSSNYEQIAKDFDDIQTQLDECLGVGWDNEDKSNSEEYAPIKTEVKDVQYSKENDATMPAIRVILLENDNKFSLFMRIK